jgi:hypothetical protein
LIARFRGRELRLRIENSADEDEHTQILRAVLENQLLPGS